tara:strand:+ start:107 stop:367 length:261 start_codon:yes stop_codon:yes gene_type:complete
MKIKVEQSLEHAGFWSWCSGGLKDKKLYPTRDEALKAGIDKIFLIDNLDVLERNGLVYLYTDTYNNRKTLKTGIYQSLNNNIEIKE